MSISVRTDGKRSDCGRCVRHTWSAVVLSDRDFCLDILCPSCASRLAMKILETAEKAAAMEGDNGD